MIYRNIRYSEGEEDTYDYDPDDRVESIMDAVAVWNPSMMSPETYFGEKYYF